MFWNKKFCWVSPGMNRIGSGLLPVISLVTGVEAQEDTPILNAVWTLKV